MKWYFINVFSKARFSLCKFALARQKKTKFNNMIAWRKNLSRKIKNVLTQLPLYTAIVANQLRFCCHLSRTDSSLRNGSIYLSQLTLRSLLRRKPEHPEKTQDFDRAMTDCLHTNRQRDEDRDHDDNGESRRSSKTRHVCWNVWTKYFSNISCFVGKVKSLKTLAIALKTVINNGQGFD